MKTKEFYIEEYFIPHLGTPDWDSEETKNKAFAGIRQDFIQESCVLVNLLSADRISVCKFSDEMKNLIAHFECLQEQLGL